MSEYVNDGMKLLNLVSGIVTRKNKFTELKFPQNIIF